MNLSSYLVERLVPFSGFNVARSSMPQIKNLDHFVSFLDRQGIKYTKDKSSTYAFSPTQKDYDEDKVNKIKSEMNKSTKPILVSQNNFVVDGHHRFFAHKELEEDINYIKVMLPITDLLKLAIQYTEAYD